MGVFDYLTVHYPLPGELPPGIEFQTKDTEAQYLERYTLTADGRLIHHTVRREEVPLAKRPYPDMPIIGSVRSVPTGDVEIAFHGDLEFSAYKDGRSYHYVARFTDGRCVGIRRRDERSEAAAS